MVSLGSIRIRNASGHDAVWTRYLITRPIWNQIFQVYLAFLPETGRVYYWIRTHSHICHGSHFLWTKCSEWSSLGHSLLERLLLYVGRAALDSRGWDLHSACICKQSKVLENDIKCLDFYNTSSTDLFSILGKPVSLNGIFLYREIELCYEFQKHDSNHDFYADFKLYGGYSVLYSVLSSVRTSARFGLWQI